MHIINAYVKNGFDEYNTPQTLDNLHFKWITCSYELFFFFGILTTENLNFVISCDIQCLMHVLTAMDALFVYFYVESYI